MTTPSPSTNTQLEVVLERIQSRQYFLLVVQHLLSELRTSQHRRSITSTTSGSSDPMPSIPAVAPTLATLLDDGKKRKRSITHFEGIPLSLIRPEVKAPVNRKMVSSRRMRELERTMTKLCCERNEDMANTDSDSEDESDDDDIVFII